MNAFTNLVTKYMFFMLCFLITSCTKDVYDPNTNNPDKPTTGLPVDFDFSTVREITLTVDVDDQYNGVFKYPVEVYDVHPFYTKDAAPKNGGIANKNKPLTLKLVLPHSVECLYVMQKDPTKGKSVLTLPIDKTTTTLSCDFRPVNATGTKAINTRSTLRSDKYSRPDNAIELTGDNSGKLEGNIPYYVPAGTTVFVKNIKLGQNCSIYIEGTLDINGSISWRSGGDQKATIVVAAGGKVQGDAGQVSSLSGDRYLKLFVGNGAVIDLPKADLADCDIENDGTISVDKITFKKGITKGDILNNGLINASKITLEERSLDNNGKIFVKGELFAYGNTNSINNNCYIEASSINIEDKKVNLGTSSMIKCETFKSKHATFTLNSYSIFKVTSTSHFSADRTTFTGIGNDRAFTSFEKVTGAYNGILRFTNNLDVLIKNVIQSIYTCTDGAKDVDANASVSIPPGDCTGEGNVVEKPAPENPDYPIVIPNGDMYTFAMEDNWPSLGDYDMNDLVLGVKTGFKVYESRTTMFFEIQIRAVGGTKKLGAGIQFEKFRSDQIRSVLYESSTLSVTDFFSPGSNGVESGNKAVLPLFDNAHHALRLDDKALTITNTYTNDRKIRTYYYDVEFASDISQTDLSIMDLNFFIVNAGDSNQRSEVHLAGFAPTNKVKGETHNYISEQGMVWGIMIPYEFKYPKEGTPIESAYPDFASWSQSGGTQNTNWYTNPAASGIYNGGKK